MGEHADDAFERGLEDMDEYPGPGTITDQGWSDRDERPDPDGLIRTILRHGKAFTPIKRR